MQDNQQVQESLMRLIAFASDLEHRSLRKAFLLLRSRVIKTLSNSPVLKEINSEEEIA